MSTTTTRNRNYCITVNNWIPKNLTDLKEAPWIKYAFIAEEIGKTRKIPHLQGYLQLKNAMTFAMIKKKLAKFQMHPHIEVAKGNWDSNITYCSKDDGNKHEWGTAKKSQGKRNDLKEMMDLIDNGATNKEVREAFPSQWYRYTKAIGMHLREKTLETTEAEIKKDMEKVLLRDWQKEALDKLLTQDNRKVLWVVDPVGNNGKSYLSKWLCAMHKAFYVAGGKTADIAYAYKMEPIVVCDLARQKREVFNYAILEGFKNGIIFSSKYESACKKFRPAKVIVFSNWEPDMEKLSADRWEIMRLGGQPVIVDIPNEFVFEEDLI